MSNDISSEIKVVIKTGKGIKIELMQSEAQSLYDELKNIFEKEKEYIPQPYPYPIRYPWYDRPWYEITWTSSGLYETSYFSEQK